MGDAVSSLYPATPSATAPPGVAAGSGAVGTSDLYARADHTHATSVRRVVKQTAADGTVGWTFAQPYDTGKVPVCSGTVEAAQSDQSLYDVRVVAGSRSNVGVTLFVQKRAVVLGVLQVPVAAGGVTLHCQAALPTE